MNRIDFNFFDGSDGGQVPIGRDKTRMEKERELAMIEAVEIVDGKVASPEDFKKFGGIHHTTSNTEVFVWKTQPLLIFRYDKLRQHIFIEKNY